MKVEDRVSVIAGRSHGIGGAKEEARIALVARTQDGVGRARKKIETGRAHAIAIRADMSMPADAHRTVEDTVGVFGRISHDLQSYIPWQT